MPSKRDEAVLRGLIPWNDRALLQAMQQAGRSPMKMFAKLKQTYGPMEGEAHFFRLMLASGFVHTHMQPLLVSRLCIEDENGVFMTGGLVEALATLQFSKQLESGSPDPRWDFDPAEVFSRAHLVNRM
ncbi:MAG TPA: hypothetical protein VM008_11875 [Phycisphaerae bacterium]|nr:hypothetical protein [Phycisphaerae bacterium]